MSALCETCPMRSQLVDCAQQLADKTVESQAVLGTAALEADMSVIATDDAALMGNLDTASVQAHNEAIYAHSDAIDLHQFTANTGADNAAQLVRDSENLPDYCEKGPRNGVRVPLVGVVKMPKGIGRRHCTSALAEIAAKDLAYGQALLTEGRASQHPDTADFRRAMGM